MLLTKVPVFYSEAMTAATKSFSPSAAKPRAVLESWKTLPFDRRDRAFAGRQGGLRARTRPALVDGVLSGTIRNGFGNTDGTVSRSLPFTNGTMLAAAREAIRNTQVAVAPCSGFHHARYGSAAGFCTFNGLMVAALALQAYGEATRVGISTSTSTTATGRTTSSAGLESTGSCTIPLARNFMTYRRRKAF